MTKKYIAIRNIRQKPTRSFGMILLILIFSFLLLTGMLLLTGLSRGVSLLSDRLGADIMVIPEPNQSDLEDLFLMGTPSEYYLPDDVMAIVSAVDGIEKMSPQTYIATLDASCCSARVQVIGFDQNSDFVIRPWLNKIITHPLKVNEVIIGSRVDGEVGETIYFFEQPYLVAGKLQSTGMGFDKAAFVTMETAQRISVVAQHKKHQDFSDYSKLISTVMIKIKPNYDAVSVAQSITHKYSSRGIYAKFSKQFVGSVGDNLSGIALFISVIAVVGWCLLVVLINSAFKLLLNERKKEFAVFRMVGATKKYLNHLLLTEIMIISFVGTLFGIFLANLCVILYGQIIAQTLSIPYVYPGAERIILWSAICFSISLLTAPLSSLTGLISLSRWDIHQIYRENE